MKFNSCFDCICFVILIYYNYCYYNYCHLIWLIPSYSSSFVVGSGLNKQTTKATPITTSSALMSNNNNNSCTSTSTTTEMDTMSKMDASSTVDLGTSTTTTSRILNNDDPTIEQSEVLSNNIDSQNFEKVCADDDESTINNMDTRKEDPTIECQSTTTTTTTIVHVIVLIHGWMGNSKELLYLEQSLKQRTSIPYYDNTTTNNNNNNVKELFIIHSATCNNHNTFDGVAAGGLRLANEINNLIHDIIIERTITNIEEKSSPLTITISLVGNSLGGLYARYTIPYIKYNVPINHDHNGMKEGKDSNSDNNMITLIPAIFCTLVTPHLGVSQNTYISIPRSIESIVAKTLQQTGEDLFHYSNVLDQLILNETYTIPLQNFYHRRLYANAYNTDFQVPFSTSAFISNTDTIHTTVVNNNNNDLGIENKDEPVSSSSSLFIDPVTKEAVKSFITLIVETKKSNSTTIHKQIVDGMVNEKERPDNKLTLDEMAIVLDSMGWTKVFCDTRSSLLSIPVPAFTQNNNLNNKVNDEDDDGTIVDDDVDNNNDNENKTIITSTSYKSSELLYQFQNNNHYNKWYIPFGHSVLVANSKTEWYGNLNSGGQPMVRQIANDIIEKIFELSLSLNHV